MNAPTQPDAAHSAKDDADDQHDPGLAAVRRRCSRSGRAGRRPRWARARLVPTISLSVVGDFLLVGENTSPTIDTSAISAGNSAMIP